jgi:hypothetical protein
MLLIHGHLSAIYSMSSIHANVVNESLCIFNNWMCTLKYFNLFITVQLHHPTVCIYIYIAPLEEQRHNSKNVHFELCPQEVRLRPYLPSGKSHDLGEVSLLF